MKRIINLFKTDPIITTLTFVSMGYCLIRGYLFWTFLELLFLIWMLKDGSRKNDN